MVLFQLSFSSQISELEQLEPKIMRLVVEIIHEVYVCLVLISECLANHLSRSLHLQNKCFDKDININVWSRSARVVIYILRVI